MPNNEKGAAGGTAHAPENDQLGSEIERKLPPRGSNIKDAEAVSFQGRFLGFVLTGADGRCDAVTPSGRALGRFNQMSAAVRALLSEARHARG